MKNWNGNVDLSCIFCQEPLETVGHLFFECSYSKQIWEELVKGVLGSNPQSAGQRFCSSS